MTQTDVVAKPVFYVLCFEKDDDSLVNEILLYGVELDWLQQLFNEPKEEPMVDCYPLNKELAEKLEQFSTEKIDTDKYQCFLERIPYDYKVLHR